jgi:hypothetical protein
MLPAAESAILSMPGIGPSGDQKCVHAFDLSVHAVFDPHALAVWHEPGALENVACAVVAFTVGVFVTVAVGFDALILERMVSLIDNAGTDPRGVVVYECCVLSLSAECRGA